MRIKTLLSFLFFSFVMSSFSFGQPTTLPIMKNEMIGSWLVKVEGEVRTRTLNISDVTQKTEDTFILDATYAYTGTRLAAVKAEISQTNQVRKLTLTTQSNSLIVATQTQEGVFEGSFTNSGITKKLIMEDEKRVKQNIPVIEKPSSDVPEKCAAFFGGWLGYWPYNGNMWLWVKSVDAKCVASYSYGPKIPSTFIKTVEIKDGVLTLSRPGGVSHFELHGDEIWARYVGSLGDNNAVFKKIQ